MQYKTNKPDLTRDLAMRITTAALSSDDEVNLKGQVGRQLMDEIIAFQHKIIDPQTGLEIGEVDAETSTCLIEITNASEGRLPKLLKLKNDPGFNPDQKKVVLYAPNYSPQAAREVVEESIPISQSLERLTAYLKKIG